MIEQAQRTAAKVQTQTDARALGVALRRVWPDKRIQRIVGPIMARAEQRASAGWGKWERRKAQARRLESAAELVVGLRLDARIPTGAKLTSGQRSVLERIRRGGVHAGVATGPGQAVIDPSWADTLGDLVEIKPDGTFAITERGTMALEGPSAGWISPEAKRQLAEIEREREIVAAEREANRAARRAASPTLPETTRSTTARAAPAADYDGEALVDKWSRDAASKISSVRDEVAEGLRKDVVAALEAGTDPAELAARWKAQGIPVQFGTLEGRVKVIAQHQLASLHAQVQSERARALGVTEFVWRTQLDDRVRPAHRAREGRTFRYDAPPEDGLPGQPINCRCYAESILPDELTIPIGGVFEM